MEHDGPRTRTTADTRRRILDVALEVLGQDPDAAMGDVAAAAGVVRRTVYGHFPTRGDLVLALAGQAAAEVAAVLEEVDVPGVPADAVWVDFVERVWPLARRHRLLLALRRSEYGDEIHTLLRPVEATLAGIVRRGQDTGALGHHLPAPVLSQLAYAAVFTVAENGLADETLGVREAVVTSLLLLGVPAERAQALAGARPVAGGSSPP